ncbi:hypothetical protein FocTR4_00015968 [Fusarium oxysporum f. sp. cubense]|uniref:Uncharacterized protein n=1 Tax=Fusarium oxysporum f. sp. cubense TaxID=61366 RepID=A0A5C6SAA4_FUSOC|nr:hypothetical protein FocTR4_00015968 [Fusarium oxysporum f. sp. cubense]
MIKVLAQLQNLHCGNDSQGVSKKVSIHASSVGYANYMASMRLKKIELKVKEAKKRRVLQMRKLIRLSLRKLASLLQRRTVLLSRTRWSICQLLDLQAARAHATIHPRSAMLLYEQVSSDPEGFRISARAVVADPHSG